MRSYLDEYDDLVHGGHAEGPEAPEDNLRPGCYIWNGKKVRERRIRSRSCGYGFCMFLDKTARKCLKPAEIPPCSRREGPYPRYFFYTDAAAEEAMAAESAEVKRLKKRLRPILGDTHKRFLACSRRCFARSKILQRLLDRRPFDVWRNELCAENLWVAAVLDDALLDLRYKARSALRIREMCAVHTVEALECDFARLAEFAAGKEGGYVFDEADARRRVRAELDAAMPNDPRRKLASAELSMFNIADEQYYVHMLTLLCAYITLCGQDNRSAFSISANTVIHSALHEVWVGLGDPFIWGWSARREPQKEDAADAVLE